MEVAFAPHFSRQFKDLSARLQEEAHEKIELFKDTKNHRVLRVHKLKGQFVGCYSFSINYRHRIVFMYESRSKNSAILLANGDHAVYE